MSLDHLDDVEPFHPTIALRNAVGSRAKSLRRRRRAALTATSVVTAFLLLAGAGAAYGWRQAERVQRIDTAESLTPDAGLGEPFTVLAVGVDTGALTLGGTDRSTLTAGYADTILLVRVDLAANRLSVVSIPRDLWVDAAGPTSQRINSVLPEGGPSALIEVVESTFGLPINHYVEIDMAGLRDLADEVGGLQIEFPAATRDQHSGLEVGSGCQALDGDQVLALTRARHLQTQEPDGSWRNDPNSDLSRTARQRTVLVAALRGLQGESLNPLRVDQLVGAVADHVAVDDEFSLVQLAGIVSWLHDLPVGAITQGAVPVSGHTTPDGASVLLPVEGFERDVRSLLDEVEPPSIDPSDGGLDGASTLLPIEEFEHHVPSSLGDEVDGVSIDPLVATC